MQMTFLNQEQKKSQASLELLSCPLPILPPCRDRAQAAEAEVQVGDVNGASHVSHGNEK